MFDVVSEFDELYKLVGLLGFSGKELDSMVGFILHSVNETIRSVVEK